jgi:hypothetical protein
MLTMLLERKTLFSKLFLKNIIKKTRKRFRMQPLRHWMVRNYLMQAGLHKISQQNQMLKN